MSQQPQYPYQNNQYNTINLTNQLQMQQPQLIETKICQRARGPHTEGEFYCGKILPLSSFSKGRAQCKECSAKKTKIYNEIKIAAIVQQQSLQSNINQQQSNNPINQEMKESLDKLSIELEQMKIEYKKYYDAALEYYNHNLSLNKELEEKQEKLNILTLSNNDLIKRNKILQSELDDKIRIIKTNTDTISSLQKEIKELKSENVSLNDEIRVLERKR